MLLRSRLTSRHSEQERLELSHRVASLSYQLDRAQAAEKELLSTTDAQGTMNKVLPNQQRPVSDFAADTHSDGATRCHTNSTQPTISQPHV